MFFPVSENVIHASKIVTEVLNAKKANIGDLIVAKPIKVKGGDIAYHFILKNPDAHPHFMEGEVVGLFANDNGERVLDKLSQKNSLDAILKGVITRSQYIEAQVQPEGGNIDHSLYWVTHEYVYGYSPLYSLRFT